MYRMDKLTIKREIYTLDMGEAVYQEAITIAQDIPCHLSVNLNNTEKVNHIPVKRNSFVLFLNSNPRIDIQENDILLVETPKKQKYKLYAGEIKIYNFSIQIKCKQEKIIESK